MAGAIIHEWISEIGGSEQVLDILAKTFPTAPIYCLWSDVDDRYPAKRVHESLIARTPLRKHKALAAPASLPAWRSLYSGEKLDWLLTSTHLFSHHAKFLGQNRDIPKFVYAHTPARYIWNPELDERGDSRSAKFASVLLKPIDRHRSQEAVAVAANSAFVRQRIRDTWNRDATVIYPPVNVELIVTESDWRTKVSGSEVQLMDSLPNEFILGASRFVSYKRLDEVIRVGEMMGVPVVLAGDGPDAKRLKILADRSKTEVHFISSPSTPLLFALYQNAMLYVFPPIEDFGIMPVEAMAAGARVLANRTGGGSETVVHGVTGALSSFEDPVETMEAVRVALDTSRQQSVERAKTFSHGNFSQGISSWMGLHLGGAPQ